MWIILKLKPIMLLNKNSSIFMSLFKLKILNGYSYPILNV